MKGIEDYFSTTAMIISTDVADIVIKVDTKFALQLRKSDIIILASIEFNGDDNELIVSPWILDVENYKKETIKCDKLMKLLADRHFHIKKRMIYDNGFTLFIIPDGTLNKLETYLYRFNDEAQS